MAKPDLLDKKVEDLQVANDTLQTRVDELEEELSNRPTQEELDDLQRQYSDLQSTMGDLDDLKRLAKQGEAYIEIVRNDAKDAFRTKLMSDGVRKDDVDDHPEYLAHCRDVDEIDDVKKLYRSAQMDYRSARSNRKAGRVSKELNQYTEKVDGTKTNFSRGANDIR